MQFIEPHNLSALLEGSDPTECAPVTSARMKQARREYYASRVERADVRAAQVESTISGALRWATKSFAGPRAIRGADRLLALQGLAWHQPIPRTPTKAALSLAWYLAGSFLK